MVYDYKESQKVISEAWNLAINHLKDTLGDQYDCSVPEVPYQVSLILGQDIKCLKECPVCGQVDNEYSFGASIFEPNVEICYECYQEELGK